MSVKHIVIVNDFGYVEGGASQVAITSALALKSLGLNVIFFAAVGPTDPRLEKNGVTVKCLGITDIANERNPVKSTVRGLWNFSAARQLRKILQELEPRKTIVHLHGWTKALTGSVARQTRRSGFRLVLTMHDYFVACPNGGFFVFPKQKPCRLRAMSFECLITNCDSRSKLHKMWRVARQLIQRVIGGIPSKTDRYLAVSQFSRKILIPYLKEGSDVSVGRNPIAVEQGDYSSPENHSDFLFVGRISPEKGWKIFAEAIRRSSTVGKVIGTGADLDRMKGIYPELSYKGWLDKEGMEREIRKSRCLVLSSLWFETQGLVVLEAAALGVPAIVPRESAAAEFVIDEVTGLHFSSGDDVDLAEKLVLLASDSELTMRLGTEAFKRFWDAPPIPIQYARESLEVYNEVLGG